MNETIFNVFKNLFGNNLAQEITEFMSGMIDALNNLINGQIGVWMSIFSVIAGSLLIIYFFMNMLSDVSREMFTLEKLILYFIRLFLAFMILIYLKDIILSLMNLCYMIYKYVASTLSNTTTDGITFFGVSMDKVNTIEYTNEIKTNMDAAIPFSLAKIMDNLSIIIISLITNLLQLLLKTVAYFFCIGNCINLVVRIIFAPLAVVQCFDPIQHNKGIDYIKKIIAGAMSFAIVVVILYAASQFQNSFMVQIVRDMRTTLDAGNGVLNIDGDAIQKILSTGTAVFAKLLVCQFAAIGALISANKIGNDIVGTH